jgi:hypothetical protein
MYSGKVGANYAEEFMQSEEERGQKGKKWSGVRAKKAMHIHAKQARLPVQKQAPQGVYPPSLAKARGKAGSHRSLLLGQERNHYD